MTLAWEILYADPAYSYRGRRQFGFGGDVGIDTGGAVMHYPTMSVQEIMELGTWVEHISADNALLFLWVPNPLLEDGMAAMKAWKFKFATVGFVWYKQKTNPGYYTMSQVELCLVGKRGKIPQPRGSRNERQFLSQLRGKHSAKPDEVRNRITRMFPMQSKLELFARKRVPGWDAFGDEI